ncbi:unnamed protein product [Lymnaea stagnalis]|uniref:Uncharacterized protein n=1 Tax=Lymnaea stagnalis TaxID=6523 RepID=A0AAV2HST8_LYMST
MIERTPLTMLKKTGNFIIQLQPYTREVALPTSFVHKDIFNDLAVHTFSKPDDNQQLQDLIETMEKPSYDTNDVEIITKQN